MKIGDKVKDLVDNLGVGEVIDTYVNYETGNPVTMYVVEFEDEQICDRLLHEIEKV